VFFFDHGRQSMKAKRPEQAGRLEDLPNIGKAIAADLRAIGICDPRQLAERTPLEVYGRLAGAMGERHDPCVLYTLLSVRDFFDRGTARPWWEFVAEGRRLLQGNEAPRSGAKGGGDGLR